MKRVILVTVFALVVVIAAGGVWFWNELQKPLYEPGMVRAGTNLRAPLFPSEQPVAEPYWQVEPDIRLFHFSAGKGTKVLVIHGGPGYPFAAPLPALEPLTDRYRFDYYDQRGSGRSTRPFDRFTSPNYYENMRGLDRALGMGAQIADIERIRQILDEDKIILVGHSWGGLLASLYAAEFPEHVRALVLVAPADMLVMPSGRDSLFEQIKALLPDELKAEYGAYLERYLDFGSLFAKNERELVAMNDDMARYYNAAYERKGLAPSPASEGVRSGGWMVQAMYMSLGLQHDYRAALQKVTAPVLVLHGDKDLQSETASRQYAQLFPNAEFRVVENAGHFIYSEQPEVFARAVGEFLDRVR